MFACLPYSLLDNNSQTISNPDSFLTRGLLYLYENLLQKMIFKSKQAQHLSLKMNKATDDFFKQCVKWTISNSDDIISLSYALECVQAHSILSSDDKICKSLLHLLIRSLAINVQPIGNPVDNGEMSSLLCEKNNFLPLLFDILCQIDLSYILLDVESVLNRLAECMLSMNEKIASSSLKYMLNIAKDRSMHSFIFDCERICQALLALLTSPERNISCIFILENCLPTSMEFIEENLDILMNIESKEKLTSLLCEVKKYSEPLVGRIFSSLRERKFIIESLQKCSKQNLPLLTNLINLYSSELFQTNLTDVSMEVVSSMVPKISFVENVKGDSGTLAITDGKIKNVGEQANFNCAFGRILALLSSYSIESLVKNLVVAILVRAQAAAQESTEILGSCFYPIALGLFDFFTSKESMLLGIRFDIGRALYSLLSQVRGVAGSDLLVLILAKCCSSTSSREYLELVVSFYSDYGIRSEAITAAITKLLDLCFEKEVITDGLLRKIANVDDLVLLTKLAKGRDGSAILIECGVPVRVVQGEINF